jgi:enterochelin esterase-like enzyme
MMRRTIALAIVFIAVATTAAAQSLTARTVRFSTKALGGESTFAILLPADYDASSLRYPVVYLLHGGTQNHTAFPARSWFARDVTRRGLIAVMPHTPPFAYTARAGTLLPFETFIEELVRYVDANYRTVAVREARAIAGLSMGGFGAVVAGVTHPDLFGTVGAFSAALGGARTTALAESLDRLPAERVPFFYLACGVADSVLTAGREFVAQLEQRRIPHEYREVPGGHTWDVWDPQTLAFLDVLRSRPGFTAVPQVGAVP